jgi:signal transduction histidine kinase
VGRNRRHDAERAADAELERLARDATIAVLGSGVAHELSTPLSVIIARAEQLRGDERATRAADIIIDQARYIDRIVRSLLGLAHDEPVALVEVSPDRLVADALALVAHRFARKGVELVPQVPSGAPAIRCEPQLLVHALVSLLLHACEVSPAGTRVELALETGGAAIAFCITDEGDAPATEATLFSAPPGANLGIAIAHEIARTHHGVLERIPRVPRGTRATIRIPLH